MKRHGARPGSGDAGTGVGVSATSMSLRGQPDPTERRAASRDLDELLDDTPPACHCGHVDELLDAGSDPADYWAAAGMSLGVVERQALAERSAS